MISGFSSSFLKAALPGFVSSSQNLVEHLGTKADGQEVVLMHHVAVLTTLEIICKVNSQVLSVMCGPKHVAHHTNQLAFQSGLLARVGNRPGSGFSSSGRGPLQLCCLSRCLQMAFVTVAAAEHCRSVAHTLRQYPTGCQWQGVRQQTSRLERCQQRVCLWLVAGGLW